MPEISASFTVDSWESANYDEAEGAELGRTSLTKTFSGAIEGSSAVEMISGITGTSRAYAAFERLSVSLGGRKGTFVLQHAAFGPEGVDLRILPGSGTGELTGISGTASIERHQDGSHTFTLSYELP
ncbi:DUF3224 domain-containing protein [Amycolatopsis anabasis]|uniref:DUF3224 domain-containing protein n=1 Tax=Amycolatopsis anabasis TaxID=1840409 RepID=UPI00131E66BF|nr:DUF3224 domain-containing protein [Amycolatopsis anabasis]